MSANKTTTRLIRSQMEDSMIRSESERYFIVESSLKTILSAAAVEKAVGELACQPQDRIQLANAISAQGVMIFAMLIWMKEEEHIVAFRSHNVWDSRLPFDESLAKRIVPHIGGQIAREDQWRFLPFTFPANMADHHWEIDKRQIIPFVGKNVKVAGGGFGDIYSVDIATPQQSFFVSKASRVQVIRKQQRKLDGEGVDPVIHETKCLRLLNKLEHPNIIRLLGSYTYDGDLNFLFPRLTMDLRAFLKSDTRFGQFKYGLTFYTALRGLCSALVNVHSLHLNQAQHGVEYEAVGYHHDIRPANILVSPETFILADFGLGNFKDIEVLSQTGWTWTTGDYLAPECINESFKSQSVGRAIDVWAIACLTADLITYTHKGPVGVKDFSDKRLSPSRMPCSDDSTFHGIDGEVKNSVLDWMRGLPYHDPDGVPFHGLSTLAIQALKREPQQRPKIGEIHGQLTLATLKAHFQTVRSLFSRCVEDGYSSVSADGPSLHPLWFSQKRFLAWAHSLDLDVDDNPHTDTVALEKLAEKSIKALMELFCELRGSLDNPGPALVQKRAAPGSGSRQLDDDERQVDQHVQDLWSLLPQNLSRRAVNYWHATVLSVENIDDIQCILASQLSAFDTSKALAMMRKVRLAIQQLDPRGLDDSTQSWMLDPSEVEVIRSGGAYDIGTFRKESPVLVEWMWYAPGWASVDPRQRSLVMSLRAQSFGMSPKPQAFRTLDCVGVFEETGDRLGYGFIYQVPPKVAPKPTTLHQLFDHNNRGSKPQPSLGDKFKLALNIANFLTEFHTIGWLHENFNSRSVLFFRSQSSQEASPLPSKQELMQPYVIGLHKSRPDGTQWQTDGPDSHGNSDYQHPEYARTGRYKVEFDYYSLGVVLLEIGFWRSLDSLLSKNRQMGGPEIRQELIDRCRNRLAPKVGEVFKDVVLRCMEENWTRTSSDTIETSAAGNSSHRTAALGSYIDDIIQPLERLTEANI